MGQQRFSMRALVESVSRGKPGLAVLAAAALGVGPNAGAIDLVWDDAGGSADKTWSNFGNWSPDNLPDQSDDLFIGVNAALINFGAAANDSTLLDQRFVVNSFVLGNGADITNSINGGTNAFELQVDIDAVIGNGSGASVVRLYKPDISTQEGLDANTITVNNGGQLVLLSGNSTNVADLVEVQADNGLFDINAGGEVRGNGIIELTDTLASPTTLLINDGSIVASSSGLVFGTPPATVLQINATSADARFDWDGIGGGVLQANASATLDINVSPGTDAFSGEMNLFTGATIDISSNWSMDSGTINANTPSPFVIIGEDPLPGTPATLAGGSISMTGGTINVDDAWDSLAFDNSIVSSGGTINNEGHLIFNNGATIQSGTDFNMIGSGARITVNGSSVNIDTPDFDLDASAATTNTTTINNGGILDLDLGVGADTTFNHDITFNNGGELDVTTDSNTWQIASSATVTANGGGTVSINGEALSLNGDVTVNDGGFFNINAVTTTSASTTVVVNDGRVNFSIVTYNGGSYTGNGELFMGSLTVASPTTVNVATTVTDDGTSNINANLTINADQLTTGNPATDGIDGTTNIANDAVFTVNINGGGEYRWDGTLNYNGDASENTFLAGSDVQVFGTMNITGDGASSAVLHFNNGSTVNINTAADGFTLQGGGNTAGTTNTINGGTINGPGELRSDGPASLRGFGTIDAPIDFDLSTSQLIAEGGTLNVGGNLVDVGTIGTVAGGTLNFTNPWNTAPSNTVRLDGGTISGSTITNDEGSGIEGQGLVTAQVINDTVLDADSGGTLEINNASNDWDGSTNAGALVATGAGSILEAVDNNPFLFQGSVIASAGGVVFASGFELEFQPGSDISLNGNGTYRSNNATDIGGTVTSSGSQNRLNINSTAVFESTSNSTLNNDLLLDNAATNIETGATFSGVASLINAPGRTTRLFNNANVGVLVENRGNLELGTGSTSARGDVADYVQTATGTTSIDIAGDGLGQFDRLFANGNAQLAGEIDLTLTGGYVPDLLDSVTVVNSAGLIGTFDTVGGVLYAPGAALAVTYTATTVQVTATLPGDTDLDGDVDDTDLGVSISNFTGPGGTGETWSSGDIDGDGDVDDSDLGLSISNFTGPLAPASVPEPGVGALLALGGLALSRRRRSV